MSEYLILVDSEDRQIGTEEKLKAHQLGKLHRCFSILVFNKKKQLLLQQRALNKYHCGGLWTNTCCGHPRPGELTKKAAQRRLKEEFGFDCDLKEVSQFTYKAKFDHGLTEHEFDHVFLGFSDKEPCPDPQEIAAFKWLSLPELREDIKKQPKKYTIWFKIMLDKLDKYLSLI